MLSKPRHEYVHTGLIYITGLLSFVVLASIAEPAQDKAVGLRLGTQQAEKQKVEAIPVFFKRDVFADVALSAKAYVVYDIADKTIVASKNEREVMPLASLTKVMTALASLAMAPPETQIEIKESARTNGGYDMGLHKGQAWRLDELLKYSLTFSSNDAMYAIADYFGKEQLLARMNAYGKTIGGTLAFTDPAGLDNNQILGGRGSALDVALLMAEARRELPDILDSTTHQRTNVTAEKTVLHGVPNTNQDVANIIGIEASKTGFTDLAGGNLAIVTDISLGHPVVIVILGSTRQGRFTDAEILYQALLQSVK